MVTVHMEKSEQIEDIFRYILRWSKQDLLRDQMWSVRRKNQGWVVVVQFTKREGEQIWRGRK